MGRARQQRMRMAHPIAEDRASRCPLTDRQTEALLLLRQVSRQELLDVADYLQDDASFHHEIVLDEEECAASAALAAFVRELAREESCD